MKPWERSKLFDVANLALGVFLFLSPWIFRTPIGLQSDNAYFSGIIIAFIAVVVLAEVEIWEECLNLVAGLWVLISPWVLGFTGTTAARVAVVIGALVTLMALIELWIMVHSQRSLGAGR